MLPERKREIAGSAGGPGGFEVRVIGGSAPTALELADGEGHPGVEVGVVIGGGSPRARGGGPEEDPVLRLEAEDQGEPLKARSMSEVGPAVPRARSTRKKKGDRLQRVTLWMAAGVCCIAVLTVGALMAARREALPKPPVAKETAAVPVDAAAVESERFIAGAGGLIDEAEACLRRYAGAKAATEALPLLRDAERVKPDFLRKWQAWGADPLFANHQPFEMRVETSGPRPYIQISGMKGDFSSFQAVFVRQGDKMLLDWEATAGTGDLDMSGLQAGEEAKNALLRAVVSSAVTFTPEFPEAKYRSYRLADGSGGRSAWAYAEIGSPAAMALSREMNEGSFLMDKYSSVAFTLKVSGPVRPGSNQYLITETLHKGWVSP